MRKFIVIFLPSFRKDLDERILYIAEQEQDIDRAYDVMTAVMGEIEKRSYCADSCEPILSRNDDTRPYYRIYVKNYIVYYVTYEVDGQAFMEVRAFRHERENRDEI